MPNNPKYHFSSIISELDENTNFDDNPYLKQKIKQLKTSYQEF